MKEFAHIAAEKTETVHPSVTTHNPELFVHVGVQRSESV